MTKRAKSGEWKRANNGGVRVPTHLEEAPAFLLTGPNRTTINRIEWAQSERAWVIRGDSDVGLPGGLAQRLWLALMALYADQRTTVGIPGVVFFTLNGLRERAGLAKNRTVFDRMRRALIQLDGVRMYVTGAPLPGPEPLTMGLGGSTYLYSFLGPERVDVPEDELMRDQMPLPGLAPPARFRRHSSVRLSPYVTQSLDGHHGRTVQGWVFDLPSDWAIRIVRFVGKRAYRDQTLRLDLSRYGAALPALTIAGSPMLRSRLVDQLDSAHGHLYGHGFIADVVIDHEMITYRLGGACPVDPDDARAQAVIDELVGIFGEDRRRGQMEAIVADLGPDRAHACIRDWRDAGFDSGPIDRRLARLMGLIKDSRQTAGRDRARRQPLEGSRREQSA